MVDYFNSRHRRGSSRELEEKEIVISELSDTLKKTLKYLDQVKQENKILQENISKLFNTAKIDNDYKTNKILGLEKRLRSYVADENSKSKKRKIEEKNKKNPKKRKHEQENTSKNHSNSKYHSRSEKKPIKPSSDETHRNKKCNHDRSKSKPSQESNKSRESKNDKYYERETRKLLEKIRKNQDQHNEKRKTCNNLIISVNISSHKRNVNEERPKRHCMPSSADKKVGNSKSLSESKGKSNKGTKENNDYSSKDKTKTITTTVKSEDSNVDNANNITITASELPKSEENDTKTFDVLKDRGKDNEIKTCQVPEDGENENKIETSVILEDGEISNDIFDDITQLLNEIQEDENEIDVSNNNNVLSSSTLSDISIDSFSSNRESASNNSNLKSSSLSPKKKAFMNHVNYDNVSSVKKEYTMKFEDPFNTKDWRDDPLTFVPRKWSDMRIYDVLPYVDDRKSRASNDVEIIDSDSTFENVSPDCPF